MNRRLRIGIALLAVLPALLPALLFGRVVPSSALLALLPAFGVQAFLTFRRLGRLRGA
ncbi:hypothetical protein [Streptomyces sp. CB01881]|uniref:hypothetical protein n=1 Tax=Streptomyces sp. CB01881 TaxID=2078691 RepID=UPI00129CF82C|nr:hypothetical protein [Streptomyces sp. CB01881]